MAKKLFSGSERYHGHAVYALLVVFSLMLLYQIIIAFIDRPSDSTFHLLLLLLLTFLIGLSWWLLLKFRLHIKLSKKSITLRFYPLFLRKMKFSRKEVESVQFIKISERALWSGGLVHFSSDSTLYGVGNNCGILVKMKNSKQYFIFSKKLYDDREILVKNLQDLGWNIDQDEPTSA